jgi:small subunit ribosomal protein S6
MNTKKYEAMAIVRPDLADPDVQKITDRFKSVVEEKGGTVAHAAIWDRRRLTYPIRSFREGTYVLLQFEAGGEVPHELNRLMRIHDDIIRHRVFKVEE